MESFYKHWNDNGCDYQQGVDFYSKNGKSDTLKKLFSSGENNFTSRKLDEELFLLKDIYFKPESASRAKPKIDRSKLTPTLQFEFDKLSELIRQMSYLHPQLSIVTDENDRAKIADQILTLASERRVVFNRLDHFIQTGQDLVRLESKRDQPSDKTLSQLQLKDELLRLRSQRSKLKTKANRVADYNAVVERIRVVEMEMGKF